MESFIAQGLIRSIGRNCRQWSVFCERPSTRRLEAHTGDPVIDGREEYIPACQPNSDCQQQSPKVACRIQLEKGALRVCETRKMPLFS